MPTTPQISILGSMRLPARIRVVLALGALVLLALPTVAGGARQRPNDGTLSLRGGKGVIQIAARGTILGRATQGQVLVIDRNPFDASKPIVRGGRAQVITNRRVIRQGRNIRFRLPAGLYRLRVKGRGIEINAVGRGSVTMDGDERYADTGLYSLNGEDFLPVPYESVTMPLVATAQAPRPRRATRP
jgi:hypothetical protein